jgi:hypothetical protein
MILKPDDLLHLKSKNLTVTQVEEQLNYFIEGFPFLKIKSSVSEGKGIVRLTEEEETAYEEAWNNYLLEDRRRITKFVPASGAASRMFKDLFSFLSASYDVPETDFEETFFAHIEDFAFFDALNDTCLANEGLDVRTLIAEGNYKAVVGGLLNQRGLNYGSLPKGLLLFHHYPEGARTAMEEHLVEGALYAKNVENRVAVHFTVSPEHLSLFGKLVGEKVAQYERMFDVKYDLSFSTQQSDTDTIAVDGANAPFRDVKGRLVFRPGGHGALIRNLNGLEADVVFIKNIDNVVPDRFKAITVRFKKVIAGMLTSLQRRMFEYVRLIESGDYTHEQVEEMIHFLQDDLWVKNPEIKYLEDVELVLYIKRKLMRPLRVCGMVRNIGEPGGGPFLTVNADGTVSPQILESSQIDPTDADARNAFEQGSYFNPVDLVCALKDAHGNRYNLPDFVDRNTGFISQKSKDGRALKALELPGLWNGAMSDWNTVFVEVPIETFNPVKTVNDLLRPQHQ